jgi:hypothetical protein
MTPGLQDHRANTRLRGRLSEPSSCKAASALNPRERGGGLPEAPPPSATFRCPCSAAARPARQCAGVHSARRDIQSRRGSRPRSPQPGGRTHHAAPARGAGTHRRQSEEPDCAVWFVARAPPGEQGSAFGRGAWPWLCNEAERSKSPPRVARSRSTTSQPGSPDHLVVAGSDVTSLAERGVL